ncbi:MAG: hypothetical protein M3O01_09915 [Pseudomonadota bacterium]|nr:hypothetical protein [Pseudomonadota bacterium]
MRRHPPSSWRRRAALGVLTAALAAGFFSPARAQLGGSATLDTDARFRGVSLSDSRPSLRLTLNLDGAASWYAGASITRANLVRDQRYEQVLGYAGAMTRAGPWLHLEFGASASHFSGDSGDAHDASYDYVEPYVGVLGERWSTRLYYAPNYFGRHVQTAYLELDGHLLLTERLRIFGHAGEIAALGGMRAHARRTRADLRIGSGLAVREFDLQIAWVAAQRSGPYPAAFNGQRSTWVASVSYAF